MMNARPLLLLPVVLLASCASKSDFNYVQTEVSKLKEDSQTIKSQSAGSFSEITQYREEIASLKGRIEELRHDQATSLKRLDVEDSLLVRKTDDIESRISKIEQYLGIAAPPAPKVVSKGGEDAAKGKTPATPGEELINEGLAKMSKADYAGARDSFTSFVSKNPKSPKLADAQFYIAESYFNEKWYEKAILEYQVVIAKYTKSPKRPAALYRQALSFEKIGDAANAKARFKDVVTVYPASPEAKLAKKKIH
jgi:tol-pal system protein YbgF